MADEPLIVATATGYVSPGGVLTSEMAERARGLLTGTSTSSVTQIWGCGHGIYSASGDALYASCPYCFLQEGCPKVSDLDLYADREYDLLHALFRGHLTSREYGSLRRLALLQYGFIEAARKSMRRSLTASRDDRSPEAVQPNKENSYLQLADRDRHPHVTAPGTSAHAGDGAGDTASARSETPSLDRSSPLEDVAAAGSGGNRTDEDGARGTANEVGAVSPLDGPAMEASAGSRATRSRSSKASSADPVPEPLAVHSRRRGLVGQRGHGTQRPLRRLTDDESVGRWRLLRVPGRLVDAVRADAEGGTRLHRFRVFALMAVRSVGAPGVHGVRLADKDSEGNEDSAIACTAGFSAAGDVRSVSVAAVRGIRTRAVSCLPPRGDS